MHVFIFFFFLAKFESLLIASPQASFCCVTLTAFPVRFSLSLSSLSCCLLCPSYWFTFPYNTSMLYRGVIPNHGLFHLTAHSNSCARYV
ncbi:hypothetical protein GLYMA_17G020201v4 [Glycine max]|nr:hypothetical protein GLYMA_17G020201v4 [Glycine max]KAH1116317.1 hypothetical protein GYH30_045976 [Glycine max]